MRRTVARIAALAGVTLLVTLVAPVSPAAAHGRLAVSTPADGGTLTSPADSVSLAFTEKPAQFAYFAVTAPDGTRVDNGWSHAEPFRLDEPVREYTVVDRERTPQLYNAGFPARVNVAHWPATGRYVVRYQTVASDGDQVDGEVGFTYSGATTDAPAGWQPPTDEPSAALIAAVGQAQASTPPRPDDAAAAPAEPEPEGSVWSWLTPVLLVAGAGALLALGVRRPKSR